MSSIDAKEESLLKKATQVLLKGIMAKYNIDDKIQSTLKTSTKMQKRHFTQIAEELKDKIEVAGQNLYEIDDVHFTDYEKTKDAETFGRKVSLFIKGFWNFVL